MADEFIGLNKFCILFRDGTPSSRTRLIQSTLACNPEHVELLQEAFSKLDLNYIFPAHDYQKIQEDLNSETSIFGVCRSLSCKPWFVCGSDTL